MNAAALLQLAVATVVFIAAASLAKAWALAPSLTKVALTLALYTGGNILMLRLIRLIGMATAFSLSAVIQLVAVNVVAILVYNEHVTAPQAVGIILAIVAVVLVTFGHRWSP